MCDLTSLKGTRLSVSVDEALPDILVVSYVHDTRIFRGVLLDATKRNLPCGITELNPAFDASSRAAAAATAAAADDDVLYAVKQRYAYAHISVGGAGPQPTRSLKQHKIGKMTVRLRPRQVLCSKCKDICSENSESITRKRKAPDTIAEAHLDATTAAMSSSSSAPALPLVTLPTPTATTSPAKRSANAPVTRSSHAILQMQLQQPAVSALSGIVNKLNIVNNKKALSMSNQSNQNANANDRPRVILTRKKAVCMNEREAEAATEVLPPPSSAMSSSNASNTRTIKICYGPQGEGTVLKIPAAIDSLKAEQEDAAEENVVEEEVASKASRRAMKKAKRARKKITFQTLGSPEQSTSRYNNASSYSIGSSSPRYTVGSASPRHGLGNNSPRFVASLPPIPLAAFEPLPKKRKHKMKHKKKHKEDRDRKHKDEHAAERREEEEKDKCLTQKLSINLKRLSGTYTTSIVADATSTTSSGVGDDRREDEENVERDEDSSEEVPDFPPGPLRLRLSTKNLNSAVSAEGSQLIVGDVVWGKIQGFPWWPGKILTITHGESGPRPQAHVSWYGSSTSSLIQCENLCPYLANFKARYNKKKRGPYKDAIKQATNEARVLADLKHAEVSSPTSTTAAPSTSAAATAASSPSRMIMLVPPALASPREINVIS